MFLSCEKYLHAYNLCFYLARSTYMLITFMFLSCEKYLYAYYIYVSILREVLTCLLHLCFYLARSTYMLITFMFLSCEKYLRAYYLLVVARGFPRWHLVKLLCAIIIGETIIDLILYPNLLVSAIFVEYAIFLNLFKVWICNLKNCLSLKSSLR